MLEVSSSRPAATNAPKSVVRKLGVLGFLASIAGVAGCAAVGNAETPANSTHRPGGSIFSSVAGVTTSDVTAAFPSSTTNQVVRSDIAALANGHTNGNLAALSPNAQWSIDVRDALQGLRMGPLFGSDVVAPIQIGDVALVGLRSSVLNSAGTAAFSLSDGKLLWQDRSLECQRVDLGGALPCRQNSGAWAPFNPSTGMFGEALNPGFAPEAFGFADGVLYSARTNGAGAIEVAAGSLQHPNEAWTVTVPRSAEASVPGQGAEIEVGDHIQVTMGAAQIELSKAGQPLAAEAHPVAVVENAESIPAGISANQALSIAQRVGDIRVINTSDDRVVGIHDGAVVWSVNARVAQTATVTDGKSLTFIQGTGNGNVMTTLSLADGTILNQRDVVADAAAPKQIQSAARGLFHVDPQFSKIAYYRA